MERKVPTALQVLDQLVCTPPEHFGEVVFGLASVPGVNHQAVRELAVAVSITRNDPEGRLALIEQVAEQPVKDLTPEEAQMQIVQVLKAMRK